MSLEAELLLPPPPPLLLPQPLSAMAPTTTTAAILLNLRKMTPRSWVPLPGTYGRHPMRAAGAHLPVVRRSPAVLSVGDHTLQRRGGEHLRADRDRPFVDAQIALVEVVRRPAGR